MKYPYHHLEPHLDQISRLMGRGTQYHRGGWGWSLGTDISDEEDSRGRLYDQATKPNALLDSHSVTDIDNT